MNKINNLIRRAKKAASNAVYSALCIIDFDERKNKWIAAPQLWDGVLYSGNMEEATPEDWQREYDTADEAAEAVNSFFESLNIPDPDRVVILIDDVGV